MWRLDSVHERGETESMDLALRRIATPERLARVEETLARADASEPLFHDMLRTPQTPPYHAEGPTVRDHLACALTAFYAILEGDLHLIDLEEFRRLKGYEGEIDELEETLKEEAAFFEAFILCHDAPKWATVSFEAEPDSSFREVFALSPSHYWKDEGVAERAKMRATYVAAFKTFAYAHRGLAPAELGVQFYEQARVRTHYNGHAPLVHAPVYHALLTRTAEHYRLIDRDREMLEDVIAHHMDPIGDFCASHAATSIPKYISFAQDRGYDPDDYLDTLQAAVLLDGVFGSRRSEGGILHASHELITNFLRAEHDHAPHRRVEKEVKREAEREKQRQKRFREVGLDGVSLMELLKMEPGPAFGNLLRTVQSSVQERRPLPSVGTAQAELARRAKQFYAHVV